MFAQWAFTDQIATFRVDSRVVYNSVLPRVAAVLQSTLFPIRSDGADVVSSEATISPSTKVRT